MTVPRRLHRRLQQALGPEAAEDLVNLLDGVELQRSELRAFREGMRADFAEFREGMHTEFADFRSDMQKQISGLDTRLEKVKADLLRWSFVFWVGAVAAIAGLAGILR